MFSPKHIALDLDEVISPFLCHFTRYYNRKVNNSCHKSLKKYIKKTQTIQAYDFSSILGIEDFETKIHVKEFYNSYDAKYIQPYEGYVEYIKSLKDKGHKLSIVTGRQNYENCRDLTHAFVGHYFGSTFDNIAFCNSYSLEGSSSPKSEVCKDLGVDVLVDDNIFNFDGMCNNILCIQYIHNPPHDWRCKKYSKSISDLKYLDYYL